MQQFQVPQFIDVEDKIIGPLTLKQFIFLVVGGVLAYFIKRVFPDIIFWAVVIPMGGAVAALAFLKVNGRPLSHTVISAFKFYAPSRLYLWRKGQKKKPLKEKTKQEVRPLGQIVGPKLTKRRLEDLAWSLDVHEKFKRQ